MKKTKKIDLKRSLIIKLILLQSFILGSCIETFHPDVDLDSSYIVVSGFISNEDAIKVIVERSINPETGISSKIVGATVKLLGNNGTEEFLFERNDGIYQGETIGLPNVSYSLEIILPNARVIKSDWQLLKSGAVVGELSLEQTTRLEFIDGFENKINGLDLNLYLNEPNKVSKYYRWTLQGTYEFHSPLSADICYVRDFFTGNFILGESISNNSDIISKNLAFLESNGKKFAIGYSMEVKQYALNSDAYNYWKKIDDQQNNVGSVFDSPPSQILGNLEYLNNDELQVLGFFEASYVSSSRIFINPSDFVIEPTLETSPCSFDNPPGWCSDCTTLVGSTRNKPGFWPY